MNSKILPLKGKYYGTRVVIIDDDDNDFEITLWGQDDYEPSDRELSGVCTIEEWRKDEAGTIYGECVDSGHFESRSTYRMAKTIVDLINGASK